MFQVYRDLPAKPKTSNEVGEVTDSAESQTILSWNSAEGRFYKDSNGKFAEDLEVARRLEAGEAENDEVLQEKVAALLENEKLKENLISKTEEKDKLATKVKEMRDAANEARLALNEGNTLLETNTEGEMKVPDGDYGKELVHEDEN